MKTVVTSHKQTDFDALASIVAATHIYPDSIGVVPKEVSSNVSRFLSTHKTAFELILPKEVNHDEVERLVIVDTGSWQRLDRMERFRDMDIDIHLWDHHAPGNIDADQVVREDIGATVTLLIREIEKNNIKLDPLTSTLMLLGLYEDTGRLTFPSTTSEDARAAAFLLDNGADLNVAHFFLNPPFEERQKEILFEMMKHTEKRTIHNFRVGINIIPLEGKTTTLAGIVSTYRSIINVDAIFAIFVTNGRSTVIARSGTESLNVGRIMTKLGGGGHSGAGSATIKKEVSSPEEIKDRLIELLESEHQDGAIMADLMSFPVHSVTPDSSMRDVQKLMKKEKIRGVLVMENDELFGIVVLWDLKKIKYDKHWNKPVKAYMARDIETVTPDAVPTQVARMMLTKNIGHLPVVHENKVIGIVTRTDVLNYFYNLLPE